MQFDMFEMSGGTAAAYVGVEYFEIDYAALVDGQSEAGRVGGSAGNSAEGFRDVTAVSSEFIFPITDWLEVDAALRYDKYSDFGDAWSPRVGAIIEIPSYPALRLKGSWGQGFRAPDLSNLYGATAFSADTATDFWGCAQNGISQEDCGSKQHETWRGSNPDLDAETSETWSLGADWAFTDNWLATISYFNLTIADGIGLSGAQDQLDIDFATQGGNPNVVRNASGGVRQIFAGWQNATQDLNFQSVDLGLSGGYDTDWGNFGLSFNATYYLKYEQEITRGGDIGDYAGTYVNGVFGVPEWKTNLLLPWSLGDWFASLNWNYVGRQKQFVGDGKYGSFSLFNLQAGYRFEKYGTFTVGANNVFNEWPILSNTNDNADENLYPNMGRVIFVRWSIDL